MFSPSTLRINLKVQQSPFISFGPLFEENSGKEITDYHHNCQNFLKAPFFKMFSVQTNTQTAAFSNSSGLKSVFENLRFRPKLMWTVGLTVEIRLRFSDISADTS